MKQTWMTVAAAGLFVAAGELGAAAPPGASVTKDVPDLTPPDGCVCADAAVANVVKYFDGKGFGKLVADGVTDAALVDELKRRKARDDPEAALRKYVEDKGYKDELPIHKTESSFTNIVKQLKDGQLIVLNLVSLATRGHTVIVSGWAESGGKKYIGIKDINPPVQKGSYAGSSADGTDFYEIRESASGKTFFFKYHGDDNFSEMEIISAVAISPKKPAKAAEESGKRSEGKSVAFDPLTGRLTLSNDRITGDPFSALTGALVGLPALELVDVDPGEGEVLFRPASSEGLTLRNGDVGYLRASLGLLAYDIATNRFHADFFDLGLAGMVPGSPFFDPLLNATGDPFLDDLARRLDPGSPAFLPGVLHLAYSPEVNLWDITAGFTGFGESPIENFIFVRALPLPSPMLLLITGTFVLACARARRGTGSGRTGHARPRHT